MFGIGFPELILIMALALIVVGPDKLPDLARSVAKTLVDLKKTAEGFKDSLNEEDNPLNDIKPTLEDAAKNFKESVLDGETHTWNVPDDLEELNKINNVTEDSEPWKRDDEQKSGAQSADEATSGSSPAEDGDAKDKHIVDKTDSETKPVEDKE